MIWNPDLGGGRLKPITLLLLTLITSVGLIFCTYPKPAIAELAGVDPMIEELLARFNDTKAVGIFTKLSIKNNIIRLNKSFGHYHQGKRPPVMDELKERYDLMVQEIMVLIQDKDPQLAKDLYAARLMLWSYFTEPDKYALIQEI